MIVKSKLAWHCLHPNYTDICSPWEVESALGELLLLVFVFDFDLGLLCYSIIATLHPIHNQSRYAYKKFQHLLLWLTVIWMQWCNPTWYLIWKCTTPHFQHQHWLVNHLGSGFSLVIYCMLWLMIETTHTLYTHTGLLYTYIKCFSTCYSSSLILLLER
jgi:hypothetical protein